MDAAAFTYVAALFQAFQYEPAKFEEVKETLNDLRTHRVDVATGYARVKELLKDHPNLLISLNDFLPAEAKIDIPHVANKELTIDDHRSYLDAVIESFKDEPAKLQEFCQIMKDVRTHRDDEATCFAKLKELMKDHQNLLLGLNAFFPAEAKTTIAPEAKIPTLSDARDILKRIKDPAKHEAFKKLLKDIRARGSLSSIQQNYLRTLNFVAKVKVNTLLLYGKVLIRQKMQERFQGHDYHVYESFLQIWKMLGEGNMPSDKVYHEFVTRLEDHQDLVMEFTDIFNQ